MFLGERGGFSQLMGGGQNGLDTLLKGEILSQVLKVGHNQLCLVIKELVTEEGS